LEAEFVRLSIDAAGDGDLMVPRARVDAGLHKVEVICFWRSFLLFKKHSVSKSVS
jgi:hypothetical protein